MKKFFATLAVLAVMIAPSFRVQAAVFESVIETDKELLPMTTGALYWARVVNCNEWITLRDSPSVYGAALAHIPLGTRVKVYKDRANGEGFIRNGFYRTLYDGMWGWCLADYISVGEFAEGVP